MLTLRVDLRNNTTFVAEVDWVSVDNISGVMLYKTADDKQARRLCPSLTSQAFLMNEAGKTVLSHNFVEKETDEQRSNTT